MRLAPHGWEFFGRIATSPNGRFRFGWQNFDNPWAKNAPDHVTGMGQVILLEEETLRYRLDFERPGCGSVTDSGVAVVADTLHSAELWGAFYVIAPDGLILIEDAYKANVFECGISSDGQAAWCTTANAPSTDGAITLVFDLAKHQLRRRFPRPHGWMVRDVSLWGDEINILAKQDISYRYDAQGELINATEVDGAIRQALTKDGTAYHILVYVESRVGRLPPALLPQDLLRELLALLNYASVRDTEGKVAARVQRRKGEILHALGRITEAIGSLQLAIKMDPRVGAKRFLKSLVGESVEG